MEWIEVSARTLPAAIELALDRLGVVEEELEYEVVAEPRSGLFGIGRTEARIRARVKPLSREKPTDRRRRRKSSDSRGSGRARTATATASAPTKPAADAEPAAAADGEQETAASRNGEGGRRRSRRRGGRGRGGGASRADDRQQESNGTRAPRAEAEDDEMNGAATLTIDEQADAAVRFTDGLVRNFGVNATVSAQVVDDEIELRIDGAGLGVLVGPNAVTLHALEELVRAVVQHAAGGHSARLHVDVAGYRQRRREALAEFAKKIAEEVRESGTEKALEPMSPPDRKVVHDTVAELDGVTTISVGDEPRRRVVIKPA